MSSLATGRIDRLPDAIHVELPVHLQGIRSVPNAASSVPFALWREDSSHLRPNDEMV